MSSEYLGWTERKPAREFDTSRIDRDVLPGGPITQSFENYVKNIFRPSEDPVLTEVQNAGAKYGVSGLCGGLGGGLPKKISASAMLKMEEHLGKEALDDTMDDEALESPLDAIYQELGIGITGLNLTSSISKSGSQYPVYAPKTSKEYFSVQQSVPSLHSSTGKYRGAFRSYKESPNYKQRADEEWRKSNRQMLVDYKDFGSSPLSPYMYQNHPYVQRQDSRIVGSNFVQLTTRPRDRFLEKLDATLAEVRSSPRYSHY